MKKTIFILLTTISIATNCLSQDTITSRVGEDIQAKVLEITTTEIKYKKFDNLDGPTFIVQKSEFSMIRYENGTQEIFTEEKKIEPTKPTANLYTKGQSDAIRYYSGYKGAGTGTLLTSLLSPLVGLIPAIACSSTRPKETNLNYPNSDLMKQPDYNNGYTQKAKKIKQGRVWSNWGIAFGVNLVLILVISSGQQ